MTARGVHFAISMEQAQALEAAEDDDALMELIGEIEEAWENLAESDKAWDAMHRALTDGELEYGNGPEPLNHCVLGPRQLHEGDDYIVSLVLPEEVRAVASALTAIDAAAFRERYTRLVPKDYAPEYGDEDREYTCANYADVRALYLRAAEQGLAVVFSVDQ